MVKISYRLVYFLIGKKVVIFLLFAGNEIFEKFHLIILFVIMYDKSNSTRMVKNNTIDYKIMWKNKKKIYFCLIFKGSSSI